MNDEVNLDGKTYISSKRAAQLSQYAQDYIGQLCRKGLVDCKRVNGLWYVTIESLENHKVTSAEQKAQALAQSNAANAALPQNDVILDFSGEEYISSKRAADMAGYNQDYVTQLARTGKVKARQVGSRWYVAKRDVLQNKEKNDALLAAVQAKSVGIQHAVQTSISNEKWSPSLQNPQAEKHMPLIPEISQRQSSNFRTEEVQRVQLDRMPISHAKKPLNPMPEHPSQGMILDLSAYQASRSTSSSDVFLRKFTRRTVAIASVVVILGSVTAGILFKSPVLARDGGPNEERGALSRLIDGVSRLVASRLEYRRSD